MPPLATPPPEEGAPPAEGAPAATTVPATESAAAVLPLGAAVGLAGLPTMPYDLIFTGDFFDIADFMAGLDRMVKSTARASASTAGCSPSTASR